VQPGAAIFRPIYHRCPQARRLAVCVTFNANSVTGTIIKGKRIFWKKVVVLAFIRHCGAPAVMWVLSP